MTNANLSVANYLWGGPGQDAAWDQTDPIGMLSNIAGLQGRFNNIRAEYQTMLTLNNYPDTNKSILQQAPYVLNQTWKPTTMMGMSANSGFNPKNPYVLQTQPTIACDIQNPYTSNFFTVTGNNTA